MLLYTSPDFIGYHPNFPVTSSHPTGGMSTKMSSVSVALDCDIVTSLAELSDDEKQSNLIVEPLGVKAPRNTPKELELGGDYQALRSIEMRRIHAINEYPGKKILLCSEMELLRWPNYIRQEMLYAINDKVFASCEYQQSLFKTINVESEVIYEPVNEYLYSPHTKIPNQVVAIGSPKYIKNTRFIIDVFRELQGTKFKTVYVGSPVGWAGKVNRKAEVEYDFSLHNELVEVCDVHYDASPGTFVAKILAQSEFYLNFAYHEVCCRTAMEALLAGCKVIGGKHPLWEEYPVLGQADSVDECIEILESSDPEAESNREWAVEQFGFERFVSQIKEEFNEY